MSNWPDGTVQTQSGCTIPAGAPLCGDCGNGFRFPPGQARTQQAGLTDFCGAAAPQHRRGAPVSRVWGRHSPTSSRPGEQMSGAKFGPRVDTCSVTSAYCLFQFLSSAVRSAEWENGGFAKLFPSANTTVTNPPRARFCGNFFIFPFATTTVKGPAFSKSGNKKSSKSFQTYCFCCRCDGRLLFSFGTM